MDPWKGDRKPKDRRRKPNRGFGKAIQSLGAEDCVWKCLETEERNACYGRNKGTGLR